MTQPIKLFLNPIIRGGLNQRLYAVGWGSKNSDSVKYITGREILCKNKYFMCLMVYLGMFRKSKKLLALYFDPKGVKMIGLTSGKK